MKRTLLLTLATAALSLTLTAPAAGDPEAGASKSAVCQGCHGPDGVSTGAIPSLARLV